MDFRILVEVDFCGGGIERAIQLAENRPNPDVRILEIRRGVALQRKHPVPRENVISEATLRELGEFHRTDTDDFRDFHGFLALQIRVFLGDRFCGALDRFFEYFDQADVFAGAGSHQFPIVAKD